MLTKQKRVLERGKLYRVRSDHKFWQNRIGAFQFWGGPKQDVVVLADKDNAQVMFCVRIEDLTLPM
jgi:hypothetical protein